MKRRCYTCAKPIKFYQDRGRWKPMNVDGTPHQCNTPNLTPAEAQRKIQDARVRASDRKIQQWQPFKDPLED